MESKIIFIIAPSLGIVGQAKVAGLLQVALADEFTPIVIGYKSPNTPTYPFKGPIIELPWGGDSFFWRALAYPIRITKLARLSIKLKPAVIIGQGLAGGCLGLIAKIFSKKSKYILSIHESRNASYSLKTKVWRKILSFFALMADAFHFVSYGMMQQYPEFQNKNEFVITTPADTK